MKNMKKIQNIIKDKKSIVIISSAFIVVSLVSGLLVDQFQWTVFAKVLENISLVSLFLFISSLMLFFYHGKVLKSWIIYSLYFFVPISILIFIPGDSSGLFSEVGKNIASMVFFTLFTIYFLVTILRLNKINKNK
jgi:hypothetical protein